MPVPFRIVAAVLALALLGGCAPPGLEAWPGAALLAGPVAWQRAVSAVASITVTVPGLAGHRQGSGFFVRPNLLVTDFHVVAEADRLLTITLADGTVLPWARVRLISRPYDLALIETPPVGVASLPLSPAARRQGRVAALAGRWVRTACGVQAAEAVVIGMGHHRPPGRPEIVDLVLLSPTSVCRGFSGGPVLDEAGQVVGVVRGIVVGSAAPGRLTLPLVDTVPAATAVRHLRDALAELGM